MQASRQGRQQMSHYMRRGFDVVAPKRARDLPDAVFLKGSITDYSAVRSACEGVDVVFVTAAIIRYMERLDWQYADNHAVNVVGTANVIQACVECGVQTLIQTSSSNVCIAPGLARQGMDESSPLVDERNSPNHYGWTKVQAEVAILKAHGTPLSSGRGKLAAAAARPCSGIFGPGDNFITERFLRDENLQIMVPCSKVDVGMNEGSMYDIVAAA
mmetsp:Transcript_63656/g.207731  ORF Transcript_63656/g.207731 Transcript_63656/m.207731 type:complete len:215 (+) Transcript_63656:498-1142(+)